MNLVFFEGELVKVKNNCINFSLSNYIKEVYDIRIDPCLDKYNYKKDNFDILIDIVRN